MIGFKTFFRVIKKYFPMMLIYLDVFLIIALAYETTNEKDNERLNTRYESLKVRVSVIDHDQSELSNGLKQYIDENNILVDIKDNNKAKLDAIYYRATDYVLTIPKGFAEDMQDKKNPKVEKIHITDAGNAEYIDHFIDQYLSTYEYFQSENENVPAEELIKKTQQALSEKTKVTVMEGETESRGNRFTNLLNYAAYAILVITIIMESIVISKTREDHISLRIKVSSAKKIKLVLSQVIANILFVVGVVAVAYAIITLIIPNEMMSQKGILYIINMIGLGLTGITIGFLCGLFIKSLNLQNAIANVIAIGSCFLCGIFVPQSWLGDNINNIASLTTVYYYVKTNTALANIQSITKNNMQDVLNWFGMQALFMIALLAVALLISKTKEN